MTNYSETHTFIVDDKTYESIKNSGENVGKIVIRRQDKSDEKLVYYVYYVDANNDEFLH